MKILSYKSGFTLIELLVVISIIGLLSSVVLASLSGARESARDVRRKQDLRQLRTALEMYYNDHGEYPAEVNCRGNGTYSNCDPDTGWPHSNPLWTGLVDGGYMSQVPIDPVNDNTHNYYYELRNNTSGYSVTTNFCVRANLETGGYHYVHGGKPPYPIGNCGLD